MEVALTFGSLGDIISVCQLAIRLSRTVGVVRGAVRDSAAEYQQLRHDLDMFVRILLQVVATYQQHKLSPYLQGLDAATKSVIQQCSALIQSTLDQFQSRYSSSLSAEGSGNRIKDIYKHIEWSVRERERLQNLRSNLQQGFQRLTLLASLASERSARADNATVLTRVDEVKRLVATAAAQQEDFTNFFNTQLDTLTRQMEGQLKRVDRRLATQEETGNSILSTAKETLRGIYVLVHLVANISHNVIQLQVLAANSMFLAPPDPTKGLPALLEDALGRTVEIHAEWIECLDWSTLGGLLRCRFNGRKGLDMVRRNEYALEEGATGRDLDIGRPLCDSLRRGMKIYMSMVFRTKEAVNKSCPRCGSCVDTAEDVTVQCTESDCGMWFRIQHRPLQTSRSQLHGFLKSSGETMPKEMAVQPEDFHRVRLLTSISVNGATTFTPRPHSSENQDDEALKVCSNKDILDLVDITAVHKLGQHPDVTWQGKYIFETPDDDGPIMHGAYRMDLPTS